MSERIRRVLTYVRVSPETRAVTRLKGTDVGRECRLGQSEECEIFIRKEGVARPVHALLLVRDAARPGATLVNASAGAPTLLNGTPVATEAAVHSGDLVSICQRHFLYEEFQLVSPPPAAAAPPVPISSNNDSNNVDETERVDATPEPSELSVSQPARACVSEPPHVSGRREQLQQQQQLQQQEAVEQEQQQQQQQWHREDDGETQRLGFGIDFPVRKDCSLFVAPGDDDTTQGAAVPPAPAAAPLLGSAGDSLEQVAAEPSTPSRSTDAAPPQPTEPEAEPEAEAVPTPVPTPTKTAATTTTRRRSSAATRAVFAGVRVVVGPCADVARVVSCVMECGGSVGTLAAHAECAPWDAQPPRTFYVTRATPARSAACLGAAGVLSLARRVPVVDEQWVADCHRARTRLAFEPYLLRVAVPGTPALCATQPLAAAAVLDDDDEDPLLVVPDSGGTHRARFRLVACDRAGLVRRDDAARRALQPVESLVRLCGGTLAMETRHTYDATLVAVVDEPPAPTTPQRKRPRVDDDTVLTGEGNGAATPPPPLLNVDWLLACVLRGALVPTAGFAFDAAQCHKPEVPPSAPTEPPPESAAATTTTGSIATPNTPEKTSPAGRKKRGALLDGMQFILDASAGTAHVQRVIETHRGRVVRALPLSPESQHAQWAQPRLVFLTDRARVAGLTGIVALCLARAIPVVRLQWLTDSVRARTRLAVAPYLLPVDSARAGTLAQPIPFARQDPAADALFAPAASRFVQLRVVGRDGHELSTTATKSLLRNVEWLVGIMGGGIAQGTRRHYLANVYITDSSRDGAGRREYYTLDSAAAGVPDVTVEWLYESLLCNTLLPLSAYPFVKKQ